MGRQLSGLAKLVAVPSLVVMLGGGCGEDISDAASEGYSSLNEAVQDIVEDDEILSKAKSLMKKKDYDGAIGLLESYTHSNQENIVTKYVMLLLARRDQINISCTLKVPKAVQYSSPAADIHKKLARDLELLRSFDEKTAEVMQHEIFIRYNGGVGKYRNWDTPEDALRSYYSALTREDLEAISDVLPPESIDEFKRAAARYSSLRKVGDDIILLPPTMSTNHVRFAVLDPKKSGVVDIRYYEYKAWEEGGRVMLPLYSLK